MKKKASREHGSLTAMVGEKLGRNSDTEKAHTHSDGLARDWDGMGHEKSTGHEKNKGERRKYRTLTNTAMRWREGLDRETKKASEKKARGENRAHSQR